MVSKTMPASVVKLYKVLYFFDIMAFGLVYSVMGWKLFEFILYRFGLMKDEWVDDPLENKFFEY